MSTNRPVPLSLEGAPCPPVCGRAGGGWVRPQAPSPKGKRERRRVVGTTVWTCPRRVKHGRPHLRPSRRAAQRLSPRPVGGAGWPPTATDWPGSRVLLVWKPPTVPASVHAGGPGAEPEAGGSVRTARVGTRLAVLRTQVLRAPAYLWRPCLHVPRSPRQCPLGSTSSLVSLDVSSIQACDRGLALRTR